MFSLEMAPKPALSEAEDATGVYNEKDDLGRRTGGGRGGGGGGGRGGGGAAIETAPEVRKKDT